MRVTVPARGQITIPKAMRQALQLRPGAVIELRVNAGAFVGAKVSREHLFQKWRGRCAVPKGTSVDAYLERARDADRY